MGKQNFLLVIWIFLVLSGHGQKASKNIMLVLGSDKREILQKRIAVAIKLYQSTPIDKIIVSGGCAAHASTICEATEMKALLEENGISGEKIYKEENSKTTAQNYVFSRALADESGQRIIQPGDRLFVVSDHWHAIAVAARFRKYDQVDARFFIEGDLDPPAGAPLDYVGIFNKITDNRAFIVRSTWPTPLGVFYLDKEQHLLFLDRVYQLDGSDHRPKVSSLQDVFAELPPTWEGEIEAVIEDTKGKQLHLIRGLELQSRHLPSQRIAGYRTLQQWVQGLPGNVHHVDAGFIAADLLYLFSGDAVYIARKQDDQYHVQKSLLMKEWINPFPYGWAKGDISAATYDPDSQQVCLFKNRETLTFHLKNTGHATLAPLKLEWVELTTNN